MPPFVVSPAAPHELLPACRLLFSANYAEHSRERLLTGDNASGLFVARDVGVRLHAAALVQVVPGALGVAWAPRGDSGAAVDAVTATACAWLREHGVKVCQAFATASEAADMAPLERSGFRHVTQLVFLRSNRSPQCEATNSLSFVADAPPYSDDFAFTLLATHEDTRDCPELNASRTPEEVLAGFGLSKGESYLAWRRDDRVGVVMFEPGPEPDEAELTYLGVVPGARCSGLGAELLKFAITEAALSGVQVLTVSVDVRNTPAMKLYARHGFVEYARREVWLATWPK